MAEIRRGMSITNEDPKSRKILQGKYHVWKATLYLISVAMYQFATSKVKKKKISGRAPA
jgi:hypothetical protein